MLTSYADDEALFASIIAGASGYLLKQTRGQAVVDAITTVASGRSLLDPDVTGKVLERIRESRAEDPAIAALTDQERKVLGGLAEGHTNREIGEKLFLSDIDDLRHSAYSRPLGSAPVPFSPSVRKVMQP